MDEAMSGAWHINNRDRVALPVEGDDGTRLTKQQLASVLINSERESDRGSGL